VSGYAGAISNALTLLMSVSTATGLVELFLHPPLGLMRLEPLPNGPYAGLFTITRPRLNVNVDAYGFRYLVQDFPAGYGITPGPGTNYFDRTVVSAALTHQLLDGAIVTSQTGRFNSTAAYLLFNESFPRGVTIETAPGITVNLWWMVRLI